MYLNLSLKTILFALKHIIHQFFRKMSWGWFFLTTPSNTVSIPTRCENAEGERSEMKIHNFQTLQTLLDALLFYEYVCEQPDF